MNLFYLKPIDTTKMIDKKEILWHNMKLADKYFNTNMFMACMIGWKNLNPSKNWSDLERELRIQELNTHLYVDNNNNNSLLIISCQDKVLAIQEVLKYNKLYEDNLKLLETAVFSDTITYVDIEKEQMDLLRTNDIQIFVEVRTPTQILDTIKEKILEIHKQTPSTALFGMSDDGYPMYAFVIGKKVVSDIGYIDRTSEMEIIQLSL